MLPIGKPGRFQHDAARIGPGGNRARDGLLGVGSDVWIFGYGSLIWRPDFPWLESRKAAIEGWSRRFWQGSTDHRGVPGAPGRVVTLIPETGARCWGRAYRIDPAQAGAILDRLAHREKGGYDRISLGLRFADPAPEAAGAPAESPVCAPVRAHVYFANRDNPDWLGPAPLPEIARQIRRSHGPSGANIAYVQELAAALRAMAVADAHVFALAALLNGEPAPAPGG